MLCAHSYPRCGPGPSGNLAPVQLRAHRSGRDASHVCHAKAVLSTVQELGVGDETEPGGVRQLQCESIAFGGKASLLLSHPEKALVPPLLLVDGRHNPRVL